MPPQMRAVFSMSQGTCWASPEAAFAPRYESPQKNVQINRYAPMKTHVGPNARPKLARSRWTRAKTRISGATVGNIIAIIITTQIVRNNAAPMPMVRPMPIPLAVLDCQTRITHDAAARISSSARIRVRSRCKLIALPLSVKEPRPSCTAVLKFVSMRSVLVSVMVPDPGLRIFQTLLIASLGNQVEVLVGGIHHIDAPRVTRVGVKNRAVLAFIEDADALTVHHAGVRSCIVEERR